MAIKAYGRSLVSYDTWESLKEYDLEDRVVPIVPNGKCYECTTEGTSGETEPPWNNNVGQTTPDGTVVWTCKDIPFGANPLTVVLSSVGQGGLGLLEIWIKSNIESEFLVYGSDDGTDGTWRLTDELAIPTKQGKYEKHEGYFNAYHFVKVFVDGVGEHEIEIIAGEM